MPATTVLVATDIFGATEALRQRLAELQQQCAGFAVIVEQPTSCIGLSHVFDDDQIAYQAFVADGGLPRYVSQIRQRLSQQPVDFVLGFSAGAAALWCVLGQGSTHSAGLAETTPILKPGRALLCYGGQIRQHAELHPICPVTAVWSDERHFDVVALQQALQQNLSPHPLRQLHWPYAHGFINPHSAGYDAAAAEEFWMRCQTWLGGEEF